MLYGNLEQRRVEQAAVRQGATDLSQLVAAREEDYVGDARQLLATLSDIKFLVLATNPAPSQEHFANLRKLLPDYLNFGLIETNGILFCSADPADAKVDLNDRLYFRRVVETKSFSTGEYQIGRMTGQSALNPGYPVFDEKGRLRRVLYASLRLSLLSEAMKKISLPANSTVTVLDHAGVVLEGLVADSERGPQRRGRRVGVGLRAGVHDRERRIGRPDALAGARRPR